MQTWMLILYIKGREIFQQIYWECYGIFITHMIGVDCYSKVHVVVTVRQIVVESAFIIGYSQYKLVDTSQPHAAS